MNSQSDIGQKIQYFRKLRGLSQLDLEIAINAAPGSISRIESGKTNPTKETILSISRALNLQQIELSYLLGVLNSEPSPEETEAAIKHVQSMLKQKDTFCYLLDNKSDVIEVSEGFKDFLKSLGVEATNLIGFNIVEILFDPKFNVRQSIQKEAFQTVARNTVAVLYQERSHLLKEKPWVELLERLNKLPDFIECWEYVKQNKIEVLTDKNRTIIFNQNGVNTEMIITPIYLYSDPRFIVVQYLPK